MAPHVKLTYFNGRQRGEVIRWILSYGGQEFTDNRIDFGEWFKDREASKAKTPLGNVPYIEVDGKRLGQSHAIGRYLARQNGCAGQNPWEEAEVDAIVDFTEDVYQKFLNWLRAELIFKDPKADEIKKQFVSVDAVPYLKKFEELVQGNQNGQAFIAGSGPTWADFTVVAFLDEVIEMVEPTILDSYPALSSYVARVHNLKGIKQWLAKRPVTQY
ncbi:hypothetical protein RvY_08287-1 [Ramazzottius varieornatus]|uniref:glutathione transferase n=1 Tax=Ramazzottius varieornatus TaxID=947166 RepID=A0A1D1V5A4_RAMVA|nr:hypothetical protein RvY_08287-1 [Ramazzottius varieornatus]